MTAPGRYAKPRPPGPPPLKVRVSGSPADVAEYVRRQHGTVSIVDQSGQLPGAERGQVVAHLTVDLDAHPGAAS